MKLAMALMGAAAMLAACSPAKPKLSEEEMATKIVDAGGVLGFDNETLEGVVGGQLQAVQAQYPTLTPEQAVKLSTVIRSNIEAALPDLKKQMAGFVAESFEPKEVQIYYDYETAPEQAKIRQTLPSVMQMSLAAADAMTIKAVNEALKAEGLKTDAPAGAGHGAPTDVTPAPAPATPAPAAPAKPATAKPAKPN